MADVPSSRTGPKVAPWWLRWVVAALGAGSFAWSTAALLRDGRHSLGAANSEASPQPAPKEPAWAQPSPPSADADGLAGLQNPFEAPDLAPARTDRQPSREARPLREQGWEWEGDGDDEPWEHEDDEYEHGEHEGYRRAFASAEGRPRWRALSPQYSRPLPPPEPPAGRLGTRADARSRPS